MDLRPRGMALAARIWHTVRGVRPRKAEPNDRFFPVKAGCLGDQRAQGLDTQGTCRPKGPGSVGPFDFYWRGKAFCLYLDALARVAADAIDSKSIAERHEVRTPPRDPSAHYLNRI
jgi:hypothetical protein